jgi:hypothetical protein
MQSAAMRRSGAHDPDAERSDEEERRT